jgi:hypothetical protein
MLDYLLCLLFGVSTATQPTIQVYRARFFDRPATSVMPRKNLVARNDSVFVTCHGVCSLAGSRSRSIVTFSCPAGAAQYRELCRTRVPLERRVIRCPVSQLTPAKALPGGGEMAKAKRMNKLPKADPLLTTSTSNLKTTLNYCQHLNLTEVDYAPSVR